MSNHQILNPKSFISQRWKNGQGTTIELLKEVISSSEAFRWRISMADVTTDGSFSTFENYDRTLILLKGKGITLDFKSKSPAMLNNLLDSTSFAGEDPTFATLHNGPITDLNVITHRESCSAKIHVATDDNDAAHYIEGDVILIYALNRLKVEINLEEMVHVDIGHLLYAQNSKLRIHDRQKFSYIGIEIDYKNLSTD